MLSHDSRSFFSSWLFLAASARERARALRGYLWRVRLICGGILACCPSSFVAGPLPPAPIVAGFGPPAGAPGTVVSITGQHFTGATTVGFKGVAASFTVLDDGYLTATVPAGTATGYISVTAPGGVGVSTTRFTVPVPHITGFSPGSGRAGDPITLTGSGFTGATAVRFNGTVAPAFIIDNDGQLRVSVPAGATTGRISVTGNSVTGYSFAPFTLLVLPDIPEVAYSTPDLSTITLTWTTAGEDSSLIEEDTGSGFVQVAATTAGVHTKALSPVDPTIPHTYRIRAQNLAGYSSYSSPLLAPIRGVLAVAGDSESSGFDGAGDQLAFAWPALEQSTLPAGWTVYNGSIQGRTINDLIAAAPTDIDPHLPTDANKGVIVVQEIINTAISLQSASGGPSCINGYESYRSARVRVGWQSRNFVYCTSIIANPLTLADDPYGQCMAGASQYLRQHAPTMGILGMYDYGRDFPSYANSTYWLADGLHTTKAAGNQRFRDGMLKVLRCAFVPPQAPTITSVGESGGIVSVLIPYNPGPWAWQLWRSTDGVNGTYSNLGTYSPTSVDVLFTDHSAPPDATAWYKLKAISRGGTSAFSAASSVVTSSYPLAPANLSATAGNSQVTVAADLSAGAISYDLYRSQTSGGPYTHVSTQARPSFTDLTALANIRYFYVMTASNIHGESANSAEVNATPTGNWTPTSPGNVVLRFAAALDTPLTDGAHQPALADHSGNANDLTQVNQVAQAIYHDSPNGVGGRPSYVYNGVSDFYQSTTGAFDLASFNGATLMFVVRKDQSGVYSNVLSIPDNAGGAGHVNWIESLNDDRLRAVVALQNGTFGVTTDNALSAGLHIVTVRLNRATGGLTVRVDGADAATEVSAGSTFNSTSNREMTIGAYWDGLITADYGNEDLPEGAIWNKFLSDTETHANETNLGAMYGLTI